MAQQKDTKTGKWMYYGSYVDANGKRKQYKKRGFDSKKEARKAEDDFREKVGNPMNSMTFQELTQQYLNFAKKRVKEATIKSDEYTLNVVNKQIGAVLICDLNKQKLQKYIDELDRKFSKNYVEKIFYCVNKVLKYGLENELLPNNPLVSVKTDARKNEITKEMLFWELEEFEKFIIAVDSPMYKCIFMTLYYMGMRRGEMMALTWKHIDLINKTIRIERTDSGSKKGSTSPKTKNSYRTITMPDVLVEEMKEWKHRTEKFIGFKRDGYVFGNDSPIAPETLRRMFKQYISKANENLSEDDKIPVIRIHDLRHSHASYLINNMSAGFTDFDIAKRLGDTVATLHSTYAHWFKAADKGIIDFMNQAK